VGNPFLVEYLSPLQQLFYTTSPSSSASTVSPQSFAVSNDIWFADTFAIRRLNIASDSTYVTAADEYGLNTPFGITGIQIHQDLIVLATNVGVFQVRDRSLGIALSTVPVNFASFPGPVTLGRRSDGAYLVADTSLFWVITGAEASPPNPVATSFNFDGYNTIVGVISHPTNPFLAFVSDFATSTVAKISFASNPPTFTPILMNFSHVKCPSSLAISPNGDTLYIADTGNSRIVSFPTSGTTINTPPTPVTPVGSLNMGYQSTCTEGSGTIGKSLPSISVDSTGRFIAFSSDVDFTIYLISNF